MMGSRHLVLSDIHENGESLIRLLNLAESSRTGFTDIWLLGDLFGHADQSRKIDKFDHSFLNALKILFEYPVAAVRGNWEYWLAHPEMDESNENQRPHRTELEERRSALATEVPDLLERIEKNEVLCPENSDNQFTLFHGCSYSCHDSRTYHAAPCESYLNPKDLNIVTRGLFENEENLATAHFLFGHTHLPGYFVYSTTTFINLWRPFRGEMTEQVTDFGNAVQRFGINPGSAGVSDGTTPCTALILDTENRTFSYLVNTDSTVSNRRKAIFSANSILNTGLTEE